MSNVLINLRLGKEMLNELDLIVKKNFYESRTELIREALRDKLIKLKSEMAFNKFALMKGTASKKYSEKEFNELKEKTGEKYLIELKNKFKK